MNEAEWLECNDPDQLLLHVLRRERATNWKRRCFLVAGGLRLLPLLNESGRAVLLDAEKSLLDNDASMLGIAPDEREPHFCLSLFESLRQVVYSFRRLPKDLTPTARAMRAAWYYTGQLGYDPESCRERYALRDREAAIQVAIVRDLFGNPFRTPSFDPEWARWRSGMIATWVRTIFREGRFDDLPILGDALEEAGCTQADILEHCREQRVHVRGCWVIDGLLALGDRKGG